MILPLGYVGPASPASVSRRQPSQAALAYLWQPIHVNLHAARVLQNADLGIKPNLE